MYSFRIEQAIQAATILHKNQVRKGEVPIPYISHLVAVMLIAMDYTNDEDVIVACLLHDALEDTDYTAAELQEDFGGKVKNIVLGVTEPQNDATHTYTWKERKQHYVTQLEHASDGSLIVSAADKIHNMRSMIEEYHTNHKRFVAEFSGGLDDRLATYQSIADIFKSKLNNPIITEFTHVFNEYKLFIQDVKKS